MGGKAMKRIAVIASVILVLALSGIFAISGQREEGAESSGPVRVGMLMIGSRENSSWNEAHWEGIQAAAQKLNLVIDCRENLSEEDCSQVLDDLVNGGCSIIISTSIDFQDVIVQAAARHPSIYFFQATGTQTAPNLISYMGRMYQMRYLAGIVAGRQSQSGSVGYVTTEAIPEVIRGIDAFALGVRKVRPSARVYVQYTDTWSDDAVAQQKTEELLAEHPDIDIIGMHIDTYGPLQVAERHGIHAIGCNVDVRAAYASTFLTAPVWNWSIFYQEYVREALNNKFEGGTYLVGADSGIVALAPLHFQHDVSLDGMLRTEQRRMAAGESDVFYGPIWDNHGVLQVADGENLSDKTLFQDLDWYVEGVVLP